MQKIKQIKNTLKKGRNDAYDEWAFDTNSADFKVGKQVIEFLNLKMKKADIGSVVQTSWGSKTVKGLGASIIRIVEENN